MLVLPLWWSLSVIFASSLLGIAYGRRLHRSGVTLDQRVAVREIPLIPGALMLFVALTLGAHLMLSNPQWGWHIPALLEYLLIPWLWAIKLLFITFSMTAIAALGWLHRRRTGVVLVLLVTVFIGGVEGMTRYVHQPFLPEMTVKERDGVILQSSACTCAAAACANIAKLFAVSKTEAEMAAALGTTWAGTAPAQIVYGMRHLGFEARKATSPQRRAQDIRPPAVLLVDYGAEPDGHAVAFMGMKGDRAEIWDPVAGVMLVEGASLQARWRGHAIEVSMP